MSMWGDMPRHTLVTPNEIYTEAINQMLNGRDPETIRDYELIMNFLALNLIPEIAASACLLMRTIFQMPLSDERVKKIVEFQLRDNN